MPLSAWALLALAVGAGLGMVLLYWRARLLERRGGAPGRRGGSGGAGGDAPGRGEGPRP